VTEARRLLVSKDQHARNKLLPLALIEDRNGHFDQFLAASARVCCQLDQRSFGGTITNEPDAPRRVYRWVRRIDMPERNAMVPKPCAPAYSERSWHEAVPTRRPRSVTCFLTYVIVDTRVYTASGALSRLWLPIMQSECTGDEDRRSTRLMQYARLSARVDGEEHPCRAQDACVRHYSSFDVTAQVLA
jgi:hypothetical protein